mmetsp:Transcript_2514/g.4038  ORF Transcript_2514/g.4038 Transcript_2514/m.4038 type:complete len:309 (+) Transcript_2514:3-929(+)
MRCIGALLACRLMSCFAGLSCLPCIPTGSQQKLSITAKFVGEKVCHSTPSDSDHNAIVFTFKNGRQQLASLLSWNILCQYSYNEQWGFPFDGFCRRSEASADYMKRLDRTAAEVKSLVDLHNPDAILLQECAEGHEFGHGVITQHLDKILSPLGYTVLHDGEFVTAVRGDSAQIALPALQRQSGKIHAVHCEKLNCIILNVHLNWDKAGSENPGKTREDLDKLTKHLRSVYPSSHILLAGDTNRVPSGWELRQQVDPDASTIEQLGDGFGTLGYPPGPTNVRWSGEAKGSEMTYADFSLWIPPADQST